MLPCSYKIKKNHAEQRGYTRNSRRIFVKYVIREFKTQTHTQTMAHNKYTDSLITAMVMISEDTNGLIIHINGFEDIEHANKFVNKLMKNSGIEYKSIKDLFDLPTVH